MRRLKNWKLNYGDAVIQKLINHYDYKTAQDLYCNIESGKIELLQIKEILTSEEKAPPAEPLQALPEKEAKEAPSQQFADYLVIEDRIEGLDYKLSKCCNPVFGDSIFGFVTISEGIKIHRTGCPNAHNMIARYPYRVVMAKWTRSKNVPSFIATIRITGVEDIGIVNKIGDILAGYSISIRSFNYSMDEGMFEGTLGIMVPNNDVLYGIIRKIHSIKGVIKTTRISG